CAVTVFDPTPATSGASGVAAGMIAPVFEAALDATATAHFELFLAARNLWPAFEARADLEVDRAGALAVGSADWLETISAALVRLGVHPTEAPAQALAPGLSPDFRTGLLTREDWRVDAGPTLAALRRAAVAAGVVFRAEAADGLGEAD